MTAAASPGVPFDADMTLPCRQPDVSPEWFFADTDDTVAVNSAKRLCGKCPRWAECLQRALDRHEQYGIFGGHTAGQRRTMKAREQQRGGRPTPPPRYGDPGMVQRAPRADPEHLRRLFTAARECVDGRSTRRAAAARHGVNVGHLSDVAPVVRWASDVAADVESGRMALAPAVRYAKAVRDWSDVDGVAA